MNCRLLFSLFTVFTLKLLITSQNFPLFVFYFLLQYFFLSASVNFSFLRGFTYLSSFHSFHFFRYVCFLFFSLSSSLCLSFLLVVLFPLLFILFMIVLHILYNCTPHSLWFSSTFFMIVLHNLYNCTPHSLWLSSTLFMIVLHHHHMITLRLCHLYDDCSLFCLLIFFVIVLHNNLQYDCRPPSRSLCLSSTPLC